MNLSETINADFITAFKAKDMDKKNFLGLLKGEIQLESSKEGWDGEESVLKIVKKMKKSLITNGDEDSLRELSYLEDYLPKQLSEVGLKVIIVDYIDKEELSSMKDMGKIMGYLKSKCDGQYDGKMASNIIRDILK
jgi:uncharacterized protein YqeY